EEGARAGRGLGRGGGGRRGLRGGGRRRVGAARRGAQALAHLRPHQDQREACPGQGGEGRQGRQGRQGGEGRQEEGEDLDAHLRADVGAHLRAGEQGGRVHRERGRRLAVLERARGRGRRGRPAADRLPGLREEV